MSALQIPTAGPGYGPGRLARLESERALRTALPASFLIVTAMLLALSVVQRFVPAAPTLANAGRIAIHVMEGPVNALPPATRNALTFVPPAAPAGGVPVPVPETTPTLVQARGGGDVEAAAANSPPGGAEAGEGVGTGMGAEVPEPGKYVYMDQLPERVQYVAPEYPDMAREAGVEGTVRLWALVDLDGSVKAVRVTESVPLLDAAASSALLRWRFTPALANGHAVRVWVAVPVRFSLH